MSIATLCELDLREVVGSVVRNGPVGQHLQEAQHWHRVRIRGALGLLPLTADDRRTHCSGSLGTQHIRHLMKSGGTFSNIHRMFGDGWVRGILSGQVIQCCSCFAYCPTGRYFLCGIEQLSLLSSVFFLIHFLPLKPFNKQQSIHMCSVHFPVPHSSIFKMKQSLNETLVFLLIQQKPPSLFHDDFCV